MEVEQARRRMIFEELFLHQAILAARKRKPQDRDPPRPAGTPGKLVGR